MPLNYECEFANALRAGLGQRFIVHYAVTHWGASFLIMEKQGRAFARLYRYNDDRTTVYLDWLDVDPEIQKQGIGTELQKIREQIGRNLGATTSCLWVIKNTWMHDWYKRRGYSDWIDNENEENAIWMKKTLTQDNSVASGSRT